MRPQTPSFHLDSWKKNWWPEFSIHLCFAAKVKFFNTFWWPHFSIWRLKKVKLPVGACLKKLISDPVYLASSLNYEMRWCGNNLYFANCFSTPLIQGDHGNHHVNLKQEKVTSSVKVQCIISLLCLVIKQCRVMVNKITPTFNILKSTVTSSTDTVHT